MLSTSAIQVVMVGKVVRVEKDSENAFVVSASYTQLHSEDKEAIVRHLVKLQQQQLQAIRSE